MTKIVESVNPYREEMKNIGYKVAMQSIRKVVRDPKTNDVAKLNIIMSIVHDFEEDLEAAEEAEERRAIREDEDQMRREKIDDLFTGVAATLDKVKIIKTEAGDK